MTRLVNVRTRLAAPQLHAGPVIPSAGERIEFGLHRQPPTDAETAEAWPPRTTFARRFDDRHRRQMQRT